MGETVKPTSEQATAARESLKDVGALRCMHDPEWLVHKCFDCQAMHWAHFLATGVGLALQEVLDCKAKPGEICARVLEKKTFCRTCLSYEHMALEKLANERQNQIVSLRAEIEVLKRRIDSAEQQRAYHKDAASKAVERRGLKEGDLQWRWRTEPPDDYDTVECLDAICDALGREGIEAWHGDATSCVEQIVAAQRERGAKIAEAYADEDSVVARQIAKAIRGGAKK